MTYPGGKGHIYHFLINRIPPHECFISGFLGHCAVMRHKRPAAENIGIDRDTAPLAYFRGRSNIRLLHGDALHLIPELAQVTAGTTFLYLDPPYLKQTRLRQRDLYRYELGDEEGHRNLLELATSLPCMVMISGYDSGLYREILRDWRVEQTQSMTRGGTMADEYVWMNYPEPDALHDYRYLGEDYRERELIRDRQTRWAANILDMPPLHRQAMLTHLMNVVRKNDAGSYHCGYRYPQ